MKSFVISCSTLLLAVCLSQHIAVGQVPAGGPSLQRNNRPTTSPYLFLADPRSSPAANYFRQVRPEQQFRAANRRQSQQIRGLNREIQQTQTELKQAINSQARPTGHSTNFFQYGSYFRR